MKEKLEIINAKVEELVGRLEKISKANQYISDDNQSLKSELIRLKKQLKDSQLGSGDTNEVVKRRLSAILERLTELETMTH